MTFDNSDNSTCGDSLIIFGSGAECTSVTPNFAAILASGMLPGQNIGSGHEPNHGVTADARAAGGYSRA
ncbi:MAG: hypothetical protein LW853_00245 [Rickettsiales bacterium]|jgi:hypothetical protein|nr:hypothetical protein [Rickettsiales bacterium]